MRTESISMGTVPRVAVLQLGRGTGNDGDALFNIEGLTSPDDMRSQSRTSRRSISERNHSVWVNGWVAVALTASGLTSMAAAVYVSFYDDPYRSNPPVTISDEHIRYIAGGAMGVLSAVLVATGLKHACRCARACRDKEPAWVPNRQLPTVTSDTEAGARDRI